MAHLDITLFGDPILRTRAREVTTFDDALARLASDMLQTMHRAPGVGLAGNQVGALKRIVVYSHPGDEDHEAEEGVWINPEVLEVSEEVDVADEGCLSIPGLYYEVERPVTVTFRAQGLDGETTTRQLTGYLARIAQHETDHLNGVLFLQHISRTDRKDAMRRIREGEIEEQAQAREDAWLAAELHAAEGGSAPVESGAPPAGAAGAAGSGDAHGGPAPELGTT